MSKPFSILRTKIFLAFIFIMIFFSACNYPITNGNLHLTIVAPEDGVSVQIGDIVRIMTEFELPQGAVKAHLVVNGEIYRSESFDPLFSSGNLYQYWQPLITTNHVIYVVALAEDGTEYQSQSITIQVPYVDRDETPTFTPMIETPTFTPTLPTFTVTPTLPTPTEAPQDASVTGNTLLNCRSGDSYNHEVLDGLLQGQTAIVVAVNPEQTWVQVVGPNDRYVLCWVPLEYVTLTGSLDGYDIIDPEEVKILTITPTTKPSSPQGPTITPTLTPTYDPNGPTEP